MPSKSLLPRGFKAEAERLSEKYRTELGISKFDPLDALHLAEHLKVPIFSVNEIFGDNCSHPHYSTMSDTNKFSAMWMPNSEGVKIILHNTNHSKYRQQSNLMHELAHIISGHEVPIETAILCAQLNLHYFNKQQEQEAKYLGGCLQITRPGLLWTLKNDYTHQMISDYYCASLEMVKYRIGITGVERQRYFQRGG